MCYVIKNKKKRNKRFKEKSEEEKVRTRKRGEDIRRRRIKGSRRRAYSTPSAHPGYWLTLPTD